MYKCILVYISPSEAVTQLYMNEQTSDFSISRGNSITEGAAGVILEICTNPLKTTFLGILYLIDLFSRVSIISVCIP